VIRWGKKRVQLGLAHTVVVCSRARMGMRGEGGQI
jgi:hypothetical protein